MNPIYLRTADRLFPDSHETYRLKKTFFNVLRYINDEEWIGACHASSAVMYVLLKEQGYDVVPCIGEVSRKNLIFDHSWLELNNKVIDSAISKTIFDVSEFHPILLGIDLNLGKETDLCYGESGGNGLDKQASEIVSMPIGEYMRGFPARRNGLWDIAKELAGRQKLKFNIKSAENKWGQDGWTIKN